MITVQYYLNVVLLPFYFLLILAFGVFTGIVRSVGLAIDETIGTYHSNKRYYLNVVREQQGD